MALRWGIIGCGHIAKTFIASAKQVSGAVLQGCAASDYSRAVNFANEYGVTQAFKSYEQLYNSDDIDVVYIATTHNFHFSQAKACLLAGKHVLCEKPLTLNSHQATILFSIAEQHKLMLMEAVWTRFLPAISALKARLADNAIGNIKHLSASFSLNRALPDDHRLLNKTLAGGALLDLGIYPITFADLVFDEAPVKVTGSALMASTGVDEVSSYLLEYSDGRSATLSASFRMDAPVYGHIYGDRGRIVVPFFLGAQGFEIWVGDELIENYSAPFEATQNFMFEISHFQQCIENQEFASPVLPANTSIRVLSIMDELRAQWGLSYAGESSAG
ncbi:Gfo/Idh/MocA family protein [Agaribacter flavus]|uniref:Gfo/Idh/MocA family protein n=1 Tax=Agaribacter flavus TaxID=1902781 RepID=A0ABV7FMH9_9ALTE